MELELIRTAYLPKVATLGVLHVANIELATLEEPWKPDPDGPGGQRREGALVESCIEDGTYRLIPHSGNIKNVWALVNEKLGVWAPGKRPAGQTWGRDAILIHAGNNTSHIMGCIAVGMSAGWVEGKPFVYQSAAAIEKMRELLGRQEHTITIRPTGGTKELK